MNSRVGEQCVSLRWTARAALAAICFFLCATTSAQTTRPAAVGMFENQPLQKSSESGPTSRQSGTVVARPQSLFESQRIFFALLIVLGLIFALRWVGKKYFPNLSGGASGGIVRVISRSAVTPKQQVLLVQVGKRVLVVADNGTQMSALSEITDPDEVAMLVGQIASSPAAATSAFGKVFGKARDDFDERPEVESPAITTEEPADESVESTRGEIDGLMEKVRVLAKQLGR